MDSLFSRTPSPICSASAGRHPLGSRFSAPLGCLRLREGTEEGLEAVGIRVPRLVSAKNGCPAPTGFRFRALWSPRRTLGSVSPPAVPGSRGDGHRLTRGAEAGRRGLDHWPAEGAARQAGPAQPGPLICFYYKGETKLTGPDTRAPSFLGNPHHVLTSTPPAHGPKTYPAHSGPAALLSKAPLCQLLPKTRYEPRRSMRGEESQLETA
ncbi:uncharacterized protein LOC125619470 [Marmota marmota marmota]|uniref:uncharacterized protein LOC125619470 n=1 Tax=Marmota marmota marmota TaxID=9994 RepID=UPI002091EFA1|nr:uncharacterized protein LOC125619470 [Marmota marmota marmota]